MNRRDLLSEAVDKCLKELYQYAKPKVSWESFKKEILEYGLKYRQWEEFRHSFHNKEARPEKWEEMKAIHPDWENSSIEECIGPRPFEFYYLPKDIFNEICESYISAYRIDSQSELLNTIAILKEYCDQPIVDKYIDAHTDEHGNYHPGYRSYEHPDNLEKQLTDLIPDSGFDKSAIAESVQNKFFEFLDMAGNFYCWNRELNAFNTDVYLGPSPSSNKEAVIKNWKIYRNTDIEIDEKKIKEDYYGYDEDDIE